MILAFTVKTVKTCDAEICATYFMQIRINIAQVTLNKPFLKKCLNSCKDQFSLYSFIQEALLDFYTNILDYSGC